MQQLKLPKQQVLLKMDQSNLFGWKIVDQTGLTFDDILLIPNYSQVKREEIDVSTYLTSKHKLTVPLMSAPMDTVTEKELAISLGKNGGVGVIHRNLPIEKQAEQVKTVKEKTGLVAAAVGVGSDLPERISGLVKVGLDIVVIDSAHGFSKWVIEASKYISSHYKNIILISGNVATASGAKALIEAGANVLRVGMGPGSICTTRVVAGIGVPQVTAILETVSIAKKYGITVIADGGLRTSGDIVKSLAAGASAVMSGTLFAGCLETPGKVTTVKGKKYKIYRGMGSINAMKEGSAVRYGQQYRKGQEKKLIAEGIEGLVAYKGTVEEVVTKLIGGLKTGMYYTGVKNIGELQEKTRFMKVTQASLIESHPHDVFPK